MNEDVHNFLQLNAADAEQIVRELGRALDADRQWGEKFRTALVCRNKAGVSNLNENSYKRTTFGRWYFGQVNGKLRDHSGFATVGKNYERMFALALELACLIRDDADIKPRQYKAFTKSESHFRSSLRAVLSEAWDFLRHIDPLTGSMMRGAMKMHLEAEQSRVQRGGQDSCVAMMDLDFFKTINDTHGHLAGDTVLKTIAGYLLDNLRRYDQLFRYGGEEFLIMLPNTNTDTAKRVLDRLRKNIKDLAIDVGNAVDVHVSASFGVTELVQGQPIDTSIERADEALFEAKKSGRNCVRVWHSKRS